MNENASVRIGGASAIATRDREVTGPNGSTDQAIAPKADIDLLQFVGAIWRGKFRILLCLVIALMGGIYYGLKVAVPKYAAVTELAIQARDNQVIDMESVMSGVSTDQSAINTELRVIKSRVLLERLIDELNLDEDKEFNPFLTPPSGLSIGGVYKWVSEMSQAYLPVSLPPRPEPEPPTEEDIAIAILDNVRSVIGVTAERQTFVLTILAITTDPQKSALISDTLAQIYLEDQIQIKFEATEFAVNWLSGRVAELELELQDKEDEIRELRSDTELVSVQALEALGVRAKDIRERITEAQEETVLAREAIEEMKLLAAQGDLAAILEAFPDATLGRLAPDALEGDETARAAFLSRFETMQRRQEVIVTRTEAQYEALKSSYDRLNKQIASQNEDLVVLNQLVRESDATRVLYQTFLARLKETSVQISLQRADSRILSMASPGQKVEPKLRVLMMMSIILGGGFGVAWVLARQFMHSGFRTAEELEQVTGHSVLGQIPRIPIRRRRGLLEYLRDKPTSVAAEAVRNLRTSVLMADMENPPQVIMSTSSLPGEGKTTQSLSLTQNLAGLGKKVLLIEADIRRRTFTEYFKEKPKGGLVGVSMGEIPLEEAILRDDRIDADILMGDKSSINAADFFASQEFRGFLDDARTKYDYIIIDTAPVMVVPDARVIGRSVDSIIYTVLWDKTARVQVQSGLRQFSTVGVKVAGLVLSQIDPKGMKKYGYGGKTGAYAHYGSGYYDS